MKSIILIVFLALLAVSIFGQAPSEHSKNTERYPNELKGFELMKNSKLKNLIPGVSTRMDAEEAAKFFMDECKKPYHEDVGACQLGIDWDASFTFSEDNKLLDGIYFYPRKRIPFSRVKFSKKFMKGGMGIVHLINAQKFITYSDKFGLIYVIVAEKGDLKYKKGDLFFIEYRSSQSE